MYYIILALMLVGPDAPELPTVPAIVGSYVSLADCKAELREVSKLEGYKRIVNDALAYSVVKFDGDNATILFCARDMRSV